MFTGLTVFLLPGIKIVFDLYIYSIFDLLPSTFHYDFMVRWRSGLGIRLLIARSVVRALVCPPC